MIRIQELLIPVDDAGIVGVSRKAVDAGRKWKARPTPEEVMADGRPERWKYSQDRIACALS